MALARLVSVFSVARKSRVGCRSFSAAAGSAPFLGMKEAQLSRCVCFFSCWILYMYTLRVLTQDLEYEIEPSLVKSWSNIPWYSWCFQPMPRTSNIYINLGKFETMGADVGRAATGLAYLQDTVWSTVMDHLMKWWEILYSRGFQGS